MSFLRMAELRGSVRGKLLCIERSQLRSFADMIRRPDECLPLKVVGNIPLRGIPGTELAEDIL